MKGLTLSMDWRLTSAKTRFSGHIRISCTRKARQMLLVALKRSIQETPSPLVLLRPIRSSTGRKSGTAQLTFLGLSTHMTSPREREPFCIAIAPLSLWTSAPRYLEKVREEGRRGGEGEREEGRGGKGEREEGRGGEEGEEGRGEEGRGGGRGRRGGEGGGGGGEGRGGGGGGEEERGGEGERGGMEVGKMI